MAKTAAVIRSIFGAVRMDLRPLVYAVDIAIDLLFVQNIPMDDIHVTRDIYPQVARRMETPSGKRPSCKTVSRRLERLSNLCWKSLAARGLIEEYLGAPLKAIRAPRAVSYTHLCRSHLKCRPSNILEKYCYASCEPHFSIFSGGINSNRSPIPQFNTVQSLARTSISKRVISFLQ